LDLKLYYVADVEALMSSTDFTLNIFRCDIILNYGRKLIK